MSWLPQLSDLEKIRVFNQLIAHVPAEESSALHVQTDLVSLNAGA
jgi:predicted metallopeptidase